MQLLSGIGGDWSLVTCKVDVLLLIQMVETSKAFHYALDSDAGWSGGSTEELRFSAG